MCKRVSTSPLYKKNESGSFFLGDDSRSLIRGGKNTHVHVYSWIKSVTGTGRIVRRVSTGIINKYLTAHYYMDTNTYLIVSIPTRTHTR